MRISDWSSDVCSSDLQTQRLKLQRRLFAGTDQRNTAALLARQAARRHRSGGCRAHGGEITVAQPMRRQSTGEPRQKQTHAVEAGPAALHGTRKDRAALDREPPTATQRSEDGREGNEGVRTSRSKGGG